MSHIYTVIAVSFGMAFLISLIMSPLAIKIALKIGAVDIPKDGRRMHNRAMPRFGGMAIFVGTTASILFNLNMSHKMMIVLLGGAMMYALGVVDDLKTLSPKVKFIGQVVIAIAMYYCDIRVNFMRNFFGEGKSELNEVLCFVITIVWIVGITNTVNLIDGLDGLATGTTAISALCIAYVAYIYGMYVSTAAMLAVAGAALGFLPFNFYPAKIFMGDSGSLYLGFMLSTLSVVGLVKSATVVAVMVPVMVLGLPIFDTAYAIVRRVVNKRPIMEGDKRHLHHRLISLGYGQRRATLLLYCVSGIMGVAAITISRSLYIETVGLFGVSAVMIYIFLTDANHMVPRIRNSEGQENSAKSDCAGAEKETKK